MNKHAHTLAKHGSLLALLLAGVVACWLAPAAAYAQGDELYFQSTRHSLNDEHGFLTYWHEHDGEHMLGAPVTSPLVEDGRTVQYFERGRLELHSELEGTPVMPGRVGADYAEALWLTFAAAPPHIPAADEHLFEATGHTLREPFLSFWQENGALVGLGYPISEPLWEYVGSQMIPVQYFERGRLEHYTTASGSEVRISPLGHALALLRGYDVSPLESEQFAMPTATPTSEPVPTAAPTAAPAQQEPTYQESAPVEVAAPVSYSPGGKHIVVSLSQQWLYAYNGDVLVFDAPVATGKDGFNTPPGNFAIYAKVPVQTMSGTLGGEYYSVPNVPHAMYIHGGVALHGTYWHNLFGTGIRPSHGCINLPLYSASWLYDWAPVGTPVQVSY